MKKMGLLKGKRPMYGVCMGKSRVEMPNYISYFRRLSKLLLVSQISALYYSVSDGRMPYKNLKISYLCDAAKTSRR